MTAEATAPVHELDAFIARWGASAGAERANYQLFLAELCDVLGVPRPDPSVVEEASNTYVFDKAVTFPLPNGKTTTKYIDLYRKGCFVCEAKQSVERPERVPLSVADPEAPKPLGKVYTAFPDARSHRFKLDDLRSEAVRERLKKLWLDPTGVRQSQNASQARGGPCHVAGVGDQRSPEGEAPGSPE